jgi:hypothetical protein
MDRIVKWKSATLASMTHTTTVGSIGGGERFGVQRRFHDKAEPDERGK